ncbi:putative lipoyltransferase 2, mitochondrial [Episyrphus balteatus]|uniref:putative lipoyltransferase 2, mitochondrial n=1 Tax=Episyrphus balteatus TaxID=286459 RepID=UPI002486C928|nr:putative lipoyltransferase 2, mitochondrial [Episyrphus balteatus]
MSRLIKVLRPPNILDYKTGLTLQQKISAQPANNVTSFTNYLLLLEHHPVYTIGIRTKGYTDKDENYLKSLGADFCKTNRGGLITFHGPGQLVAYPVLHLKLFKPSMRWYVAQLESTVIDLCKSMGIPNAQTTSDTGIWVGHNKICAIGVHGSQYITTHGIGLNCNTDLEWFNHIVPCGIENKGVTSLTKELKRNISIDKAIPHLLDAFCRNFDCKFEWDDRDLIKENNDGFTL